MGYMDMTFCPFYKDCKKADKCYRPLTPEVEEDARIWWGGPDYSMSVYAEKPPCHEEVSDETAD